MKRVLVAMVCILALAAISCARTSPGTSEVPAPRAISPAETGGEWNKILAEARKEGSVVMYGGTTAALLKDHATVLFRQKFGVQLETLTQTGPQQRAKIFAERQRGIFYSDLLASGVSVHYDMKAAGAVDPMAPLLVSPEILDARNWVDGKLPWGDDDKTTFIWGAFPNPPLAVNTEMVRPGEIKSYRDLQDPRWKGKILINDPSVSGQGQLNFAGAIYNKMVDADYYRHLVKEQKADVSRDLHLQVEWLARGKYPVLLGPSPGNVVKFLDAGAPIAWVYLSEGTILAGAGTGLSVMNRAPHPNAVKVFLNWFLGKEGQQLIQDASDKQSQRVDLATGKLRETRQPGVKYFPDPTNWEKFSLEEYPKYAKQAAEIFALAK